MTFCMRSSNMPRNIVPATIVFICRLITWQSRQSWRHSLLFELEAMCKPFDDRCLANARLANQHPEFDRSR
jgi:hypothetical protein